MAAVLCRRLRGGTCQASRFSSTVRWSQKGTLDECSNGYVLHLPEDRTPESVKALQFQVLYKPSAHVGLKRRGRNGTDQRMDFPWGNCYFANTMTIPNTYRITCSRSLCSIEGNILDLEVSSAVHPEENAERDDEHLAETFSTKNDPRAFQKLRLDYKSMCYSNPDEITTTSVQEGQDLLIKVALLKSGLTPATISTCFEKLSYLPSVEIPVIRTSTKFAILCWYSVKNLQMFSTPELLNVLGAFIRLAIPPDHSMLEAYQTEFSRRVWNMTTDELLLTADTWRYLGRSVPQFLDVMYSRMELRCKDLTLPQVVQLIYIIGEGRRASQELMQNLENMVLRYVDSINLEETGAVCLGFFKSRNRFSDYLMRKIGDKVSENILEISNYALVSVLKMIRYTHVDHLPLLKKLAQVAPQCIPSMGIMGVMHITLCCAAIHYLDENLMNAVADVVPDRISYCRSKDLAKFLWSFGTLNYEPSNAERFYVTITDQIRKMPHEFEKFPEHFLTSLLGLAFVGRFPIDLIDIALSRRFVDLATKNRLFTLKKDLVTLDMSVEIECPHYTGTRLSEGLRQEVTKMLESFASQDICLKPEVLEAAGLLESMLGGPQYVKNHMILPHTRSSDLEIHLDTNGKPIPINEISQPDVKKPELKPLGLHITDDLLGELFESRRKRNLNMEAAKTKRQDDSHEARGPKNTLYSFGAPITEDLLSALTSSANRPVIQPKLLPGVTKLAIQVSNRNHYYYTSKHHLLGLHSMKRRQLRLLGYTVVELPYWKWFPLMKCTKSEKLAYLHQNIFGYLSDD